MKPFLSRRQFFARSATLGGLSVVAANLPWAKVVLGSEGKSTNLFASINRPANPGKLTPLEAKHVPVITAPSRVQAERIFSLKIRVGATMHVMKAQHWITEVVILTDQGSPVAHVEFSPFVAEPVALFHFKLAEPIGFRVQERCNLHGLWEAEHEIKLA